MHNTGEESGGEASDAGEEGEASTGEEGEASPGEELQQEVADLEGEGPTDAAEVVVGGADQGEEEEGSEDELEEDRK